MKPKTMCKIIIDFLMTVALLILMAYQLVGEMAHEWIGAGMFVLFIAHNILNWNWYRNLLKGKYTVYRIFKTVLTALVFLSMVGLMVSGIILSRYAFDFLPISGGLSFARTLHMLSSYWGFVLMSLHIGLHWNMIMGMIRGMAKNIPSRKQIIISRMAAIFLAAYGLYAFTTREIGSYMLLKTQFVFFDFEEPLVLFFADYFSIMSLFVFLSFYINEGIEALKNRKNYDKKQNV